MSDKDLWGWIPNISGDIHKLSSSEDESGSYIKSKMDLSGGESRYLFECDCAGETVTASTPDGKIKITVLDKGGMCSLETETSIEDKILRDTWVESVWREFRRVLDSCSNDVCDCSAMNRPVEADASEAHAAIAYAFIDAMEEISDTGTYIRRNPEGTPESWKERTVATIYVRGVAKINHIYGVRFLEIYADRLSTENISNLKRVMDARGEKAETIYGGETSISDLSYKEKSLSDL